MPTAKKNRKLTVLIIEDEPDIQNFISRVLELESYPCFKPATAQPAWK